MRTGVLVVAGAIGTLSLFLFTAPLPQDPAYHQFADARPLLGINNCLDIVSNLPFLLAGAWGLLVVHRLGVQAIGSARAAWMVFFAGVALTALGSSWYHYAPSNATLVWDRLPMTVAFMGLLAVFIGEYGDRRAGQRLLPWLLLAGAASVFYWAWTESRGVGDLRPYAIVQFLPLLAMPIALLARGTRSRLTTPLWIVLGVYVLAKVFELLDAQIFALTHLVSGHSLKHLAAALAPLVLLLALRRSATPPRSSPSVPLR